MTKPLPRFLLAASAALLLFGGVAHSLAFKKAVAAVAGSNLPAFYGNALQGLWLIDAATLVTLGMVFGLISAGRFMTSGAVLCLLAMMPATTAALLYYFIGAFMPAHLLLLAAALAFSVGLMLPNVEPR